MADVLGLAQDLYDLACEDSSILAELQDEQRTLLRAITSGSTVGDIISGTKNGASYTMRVGYSLDDRRTALREAISAIKNGARPSNVSRGYFV